MNTDPIITHLDLIARALEAMGYGVEVDYTGATIIVWLENWPALVEVKQRNRIGHTCHWFLYTPHKPEAP